MIERRYSSAPTVSSAVVRGPSRSRGSGSTLIGYAALFDTETMIGRFFREVIRPGAFREAIGRDDVRALFNHDSSWILGRAAVGTLRLAEDSRGLRYEIDVNADDPLAMSVLAKVRRGEISGSSFAFTVAEDDERWVQDSKHASPVRIIYRASLIDVSPVTFPAYPTTTVGVLNA